MKIPAGAGRRKSFDLVMPEITLSEIGSGAAILSAIFSCMAVLNQIFRRKPEVICDVNDRIIVKNINEKSIFISYAISSKGQLQDRSGIDDFGAFGKFQNIRTTKKELGDIIAPNSSKFYDLRLENVQEYRVKVKRMFPFSSYKFKLVIYPC